MILQYLPSWKFLKFFQNFWKKFFILIHVVVFDTLVFLNDEGFFCPMIFLPDKIQELISGNPLHLLRLFLDEMFGFSSFSWWKVYKYEKILCSLGKVEKMTPLHFWGNSCLFHTFYFWRLPSKKSKKRKMIVLYQTPAWPGHSLSLSAQWQSLSQQSSPVCLHDEMEFHQKENSEFSSVSWAF